MKTHWMIMLALLVFATGCDQKQKAEDAARNAEQDAKVAEAVKKQKRGVMSKPSESPAKPTDDKDDDAEKDESATDEGKSDEGKSDEAKSDEAKSDEGKEDAVEKTETSATLNAKTVLDDALATAKTENKALFVHFTAEW